MHERTERAIAQLLFVFCCAVPTAITLSAILVTWTPWYHRAQLAEISQRLSLESGLVVQIHDFDRISPIQWTLREVQLFAPETDREVARVRQVDWIDDSDSIRVVLHQPEFESSQLRHAWRLIHDRLISRPEHTLIPIQLVTNRLTINSLTGGQTLEDVKVDLAPTNRGVELSLSGIPLDSFARPVHSSVATGTQKDSRRGSKVHLSLVRDRTGEQPVSTIAVRTNDNQLNCSALADYLPWMKQLGPDATFHGKLQYTIDSAGWSVDLAGSRIRGINMSRLCENLPCPIRGTGEIAFYRGGVSPGRSIDLVGTLELKNGWLGTRLIHSLEKDLGFQIAHSAIQSDGRDVHYDFAALQFSMTDPSNLSLKGACGNSPGYSWAGNGTAIIDRGGPIARSDTTSIHPTHLVAAVGAQNVYMPLWSEIFMTTPADHFAPQGRDFSPDDSPNGRVLRASRLQQEPSIKQR